MTTADRTSLASLLDSLASLAEWAPEAMRAKHLAVRAREWAERLRGEA